MRYIHLYGTEEQFQDAYYGDGYSEPWLSYTEETDSIAFNKSEAEKLIEMPLTFEVLSSGGYIAWIVNEEDEELASTTIEYRKNGGEWTSITSIYEGSGEPKIYVDSGDTVQFRGNNSRYGGVESTLGNSFVTSGCDVNVKGNIMSLFNSTDFKNLKNFNAQYAASGLFQRCRIISAENLVLPATGLTSMNNCVGCYSHMFSNCTYMLYAPKELPSKEVTSECYHQMFLHCASLISAPKILIERFDESEATYALSEMFNGCSSLTTAPDLLIHTMTKIGDKFTYMFYRCTNLNYVRCLVTNLEYDTAEFQGWLSGVSPTGTFVKAAGVSWPSGGNGIPVGWTVVEEIVGQESGNDEDAEAIPDTGNTGNEELAGDENEPAEPEPIDEGEIAESEGN